MRPFTTDIGGGVVYRFPRLTDGAWGIVCRAWESTIQWRVWCAANPPRQLTATELRQRARQRAEASTAGREAGARGAHGGSASRAFSASQRQRGWSEVWWGTYAAGYNRAMTKRRAA